MLGCHFFDRGIDKILFFFFNDTATTEIYTLSLHDALPISPMVIAFGLGALLLGVGSFAAWSWKRRDRKSTRLNSSHGYISYAVFCLKKKKRSTMSPTTLAFRGTSLS